MAFEYTKEQQKVITTRDKNMLVSAAAGSGKTAVLVERIIGRICDEVNPIDIDKMLIVTFTNAAAAEMRERILNGISEKLSERPEDVHLQRQATLVHSAQITTIDSFCLYLLKNNFNDIGIDPNFRVADEGELKLIRKEAMDEMLEKYFTEKDENFYRCLEWFCVNGKERVLEELISDLYDYAMSNPWPTEWLLARKKDYEFETVEELCETEWMQYLRQYVGTILKNCAEKLQQAIVISNLPDGPYMYGELLEKEKEMLDKLATVENVSEYFYKTESMKFGTLPRKSDDTVSAEKRKQVQALRNEVKDEIKKLNENYFAIPVEQTIRKAAECKEVLSVLIDLVLDFDVLFSAKKRDKNIIDFTDMEHFALEILWDKSGETPVPSKSALEYREYFEELMVDEYQDSNLVQEYIIEAISKENNRFMVGDVKQSIYKFRLARPELFLEKYSDYQGADTQNCLIDLHKNFRSREQVIESVNNVFTQIMAESLGGITYDDKASLYLGAQYPAEESVSFATTLMMMEKPEKGAKLTGKELEAHAIAKKIKDLLKHGKVTDKKTGELRRVQYKDIVILLRTNAGWDQVFKEVLSEQGIPAFVTTKTGYFNAKEVQTLMQFMRIIDNPLQDIPFYGSLRSVFGGFSEEEIVKIKLAGGSSLYEQMCKYAGNVGESTASEETIDGDWQAKESAVPDKELADKAGRFLNRLNEYREMSAYMTVQELLLEVMEDADYMYYMEALPGGEQRRANIEMLLKKAQDYEQGSFYGLFHFIRYMEQLEKFQIDYGEANILDENSDVVRIMSIHKSKGLEFPIVFVAGMNKLFNFSDSRSSVVMDIDYGVGMDYVDAVRRVKSDTLRKNVISKKIQLDNLGEELRVLYVALTRAKEKLYLCGTLDKPEEKLVDLSSYLWHKDVQLPYMDLVHARSYFDFLLPALIRHPMFHELWAEHGIVPPENSPIKWVDMEYEIITSLDVVNEEVKEVVEEGFLRKQLDEYKPAEDMEQAIVEKLSYKYGYENLEKLYTKTTVSELKMAAMEEKEMPANEMFETHDPKLYVPKFVREEEEVTGTTRGSAYHRVLELVDFTKPLEGQMEALCEKGVLTEEYKNAVSYSKLNWFWKSPLAERMKKAQEEDRLYREQPFVYGISASRLKEEFPAEETVLIQGIIDVFFEEDGEIVLLDYKTDSVKKAEELVERYKTQLDYYTEAIEKLTGKRVKEKLLYSFALGEVVEV